MTLLSEAIPSEYERCRKYLLTQIMKAGEASMRLASSRRIAEQFGVSHTTVVRAFKDLTADGYLTVKRGVGIFTNPHKINVPDNTKSISIFQGDGRTTFIPRMFMQLAYHFGDALQARSRRYHVQSSFLSASLNNAIDEIANSGVDGIIWLSPRKEILPLLTEVKARGLAVLSVLKKADKVSSLCMNPADNYYEVALEMIQRGCKTLSAIYSDDENLRIGREAAQKALCENGLPFHPELFFADPGDEVHNFPTSFSCIKPDGLLLNISIDRYWSAINEYTSTTNDLLLSSGEWTLFHDMKYRGLVCVPQLKDAANIAADNLIAQLDYPDTAPVITEYIREEIIMTECYDG